MIPPDLDEDRLYLFVFGPGFGESCVLRIPPNHWIVIDSCHVAKRAAALHVLGRYDFAPACVILTHPHKDHYPGMSQVLDFADWPIIGCCDLRLADDNVDDSLDAELRRRNELEQILATIRYRWKVNQEHEWWTWRPTHRAIGEAMLTALHPTEQYANENPNAEPNDLSSALLLEWHSTRLLLGGDVENPHWAEICEAFDALNEHAAMKTPHHASAGALYEGILDGSDERIWVTTPYNKGRKLPNFDVGHGPHQMLQHVPVMHLTALPVKHSRQMESPCEATRQQLHAGDDPAAMAFDLPGGISGTVLPTREDLSCYIVVSFDKDGFAEIVGYGPGSIRVTEGE